MKTKQFYPNPEQNLPVDDNLSENHEFCQYPLAECIMASGGSSQVLDDFLEFTDYLFPVNISIRHANTEDYYSVINSS